MSKKSSRKRNLMSVERLLSRITKYANELEKRLKEAHQMTRATFPMVQGMPSGDKCTPALVVHVLMDCEGNIIACDHSVYGKEQNIGLHDIVSPAAMARVTATETYIVDGVPTMIKADYAYCPFCSYACSNHRAINNHVRMHFRAILMCGWPGCYFVHMQSKKMIEHSAKVHDMEWASQPGKKVIDGTEFQTTSSAGNSGMNKPTVEASRQIPCSTGTSDTCSCHLTVLEFTVLYPRLNFYFSVCSLLVVFTDDKLSFYELEFQPFYSI